MNKIYEAHCWVREGAPRLRSSDSPLPSVIGSKVQKEGDEPVVMTDLTRLGQLLSFYSLYGAQRGCASSPWPFDTTNDLRLLQEASSLSRFNSHAVAVADLFFVPVFIEVSTPPWMRRPTMQRPCLHPMAACLPARVLLNARSSGVLSERHRMASERVCRCQGAP